MKRQMPSIKKEFVPGVVYRLLGFFIEFLTFNIMNTLVFQYLWMQHNILTMIIYFGVLFFIMKIETDISRMFINQYIEAVPIMSVILQRRKFAFFAGFYFLCYLSARYSMRDSWFFNYTTTCFVPYFIGWLIYRAKVKKLTKMIKNEREKEKIKKY